MWPCRTGVAQHKRDLKKLEKEYPSAKVSAVAEPCDCGSSPECEDSMPALVDPSCPVILCTPEPAESTDELSVLLFTPASVGTHEASPEEKLPAHDSIEVDAAGPLPEQVLAEVAEQWPRDEHGVVWNDTASMKLEQGHTFEYSNPLFDSLAPEDHHEVLHEGTPPHTVQCDDLQHPLIESLKPEQCHALEYSNPLFDSLAPEATDHHELLHEGWSTAAIKEWEEMQQHYDQIEYIEAMTSMYSSFEGDGAENLLLHR